MITCKCIHKFRDNVGKIYGYRLQDLNNVTQDVLAEDLKDAIRNKAVHVINLTLTCDNRLVDCKEKQFPSEDIPVMHEKKTEKKQAILDNRKNLEVCMHLIASKVFEIMGHAKHDIIETRNFGSSSNNIIEKRYESESVICYYGEVPVILDITIFLDRIEHEDSLRLTLEPVYGDDPICEISTSYKKMFKSDGHIRTENKNELKEFINKFIQKVKDGIYFR